MRKMLRNMLFLYCDVSITESPEKTLLEPEQTARCSIASNFQLNQSKDFLLTFPVEPISETTNDRHDGRSKLGQTF